MKDYIKGLIKKVIPSFGVFMGVLILLTLRHPASQQVYLVDSDDVGQKRQSLNLRSNEVRIQLLVIKLVLSAKETETFTCVTKSHHDRNDVVQLQHEAKPSPERKYLTHDKTYFERCRVKIEVVKGGHGCAERCLLPGLWRNLQHDGVHDEGNKLRHHIVNVQLIQLRGQSKQSS